MTIAESFPTDITIRWTGPDTENCENGNSLKFSQDSLAGEKAFERDYSMALAAVTSGKRLGFAWMGVRTDISRPLEFRFVVLVTMISKASIAEVPYPMKLLTDN